MQQDFGFFLSPGGTSPATRGRRSVVDTRSRKVEVKVAQSCLTLRYPLDQSPPGSSVHGDSPGKNIRMGCHVLLQGIFPTQVSLIAGRFFTVRATRGTPGVLCRVINPYFCQNNSLRRVPAFLKRTTEKGHKNSMILNGGFGNTIWVGVLSTL